MNLHQLISYSVALFVVCNPFSALPALLRLTSGDTMAEKRKTGLMTTLAVAIILILMTWVGGPLLDILGIEVPAFQIAGGLIVLLMALSMLNAEVSKMKQTDEERKETKHKENVAIVPLGMPLIAGPASISTVIVKASSYPGMLNLTYLTASAIVVALCMGMVLYFAVKVERILGHVGINIFTRIGGLILAANAIDSITSGLKTLFPALTV